MIERLLVDREYDLIKAPVNDCIPCLFTSVLNLAVKYQRIRVRLEHLVNRHACQVHNLREIKLLLFGWLKYVSHDCHYRLVKVFHGDCMSHV
jgi:hypothetical protein